MRFRFAVFLVLVGVVPAGFLAACLWDSETLEQERSRFPHTLELITGKFLRHSRAYYQWRLEDRKMKLQADPENDRWLDDMAVSYEKLGQYDDAIAIAKQQLERNPKRYESLANLGTFLIHAGKYEEGLSFIDQALEVNPEAHFGREKYQRELVRYLLSKERPDGKDLSLPLEPGSGKLNGFAAHLAKSLGDGQLRELTDQELQDAIKGVLGMMRFSKHDHPVLLEVLGNLLSFSYDPDVDAKQLAARCFWMASYVVDEEKATADYREKARNVLNLQTLGSGLTREVDPKWIEKQFQQELQEARQWFEILSKNEAKCIADRRDVDAMYHQLYRRDPKAAAIVPQTEPDPSFWVGFLIASAILISLSLLVVILLRRMIRVFQKNVSYARVAPIRDET